MRRDRGEVSSGIGRTGSAFVAALLAVALVAPTLQAQSFGRNKVQYETFDFRILAADHFNVHYYPEAQEAVFDAARMAERWYERFARTFQHDFESPKPLILYADHPDFQQTNTLSGFIFEGTGGVTESLKNRIILPLTGSYYQNDHVIGHEIVHGFQYDLAQSRAGGGISAIARLPLWAVEGMAEYLSVGREDVLTSMWMRDAVLRDDFPSLEDLSRDGRYFPYRFGQALWAYIGGTYGDDAVIQIYRSALQVGWEAAIRSVLGRSSDELSDEWRIATEDMYIPLLEGRTAPSQAGSVLISSERGSGRQNIGPALSPDGSKIAFLSEKELFSIDLYLADAETGEIIRKLSSASSSGHFEALRSLDSSGDWSPDGTQFIFAVFAGGDQQLVVVDDRGREQRRIRIPGMGSIANPAWSPDGTTVAFNGTRGGISDLYLYDLESGQVRQLTDDKYEDGQPDWSPDGRTIAFSSDRSTETDFSALTYGPSQIALYDLETERVRVLQLFDQGRHINPQYSPDGERIYFIADQDGFADIYTLDLPSGGIERVTRMATGVSGITSAAPALSVASESGDLAFSVFDEFEFRIHKMPPNQIVDAVAANPDTRARLLPPATGGPPSRVATYLEDWSTGLPAEGIYRESDVNPYDSDLDLDYVGQPTVGVGVGTTGQTLFGGGAFFLFSDMLGDRTLGISTSAQGTLKDIGGQAFYENRRKRWNWGVAGGRVPYLQIFAGYEVGTETVTYRQIYDRTFWDYGLFYGSLPLSQTRRIEGSTGFQRISYDREVEEYVYDRGLLVDATRGSVPVPSALNLGTASLALVGDNSYFGFVSPIKGQRYRLEYEQTIGSLEFGTVTADYRRYFNPTWPVTLAFRGFHYGRYGNGVNDNRLNPLFMGWETLIRGYANESFEATECSVQLNGCPAFDRLFGQRIAVANAEFRVPVLGVPEYGLLNFPYLPTEAFAFADAGLAWSDGDDPQLRFESEADLVTDRIPVFSAGVGLRTNILGFVVLESYWAYPFQRPTKGGHFGFSMSPGW